VVRTDHTAPDTMVVIPGDAGAARVDQHRRTGGSARRAGAKMITSQATAPTAQRAGYQTLIGAASLAVGPLIMAVGDLLHPEETWDTSGQAVIVADQPTRWYLAHLLLLIGAVMFVPGVLTLTDLVAAR